jgi:dihydrodipicolinate synthase/N-acetylneuraminate lyase
MGEEPIANHVGVRGMVTFTSGAVCLAPNASQRIFRLLKEGRHSEVATSMPPFQAFERVRSQLGAVQVLHEAVSQHVTDMGPLTPMVSNVKPQYRVQVSEVLAGLIDAERSACEACVS